jgi:hydroxymethylpyrimidine pyrophosphatase-like HAD family hydrolase
VADYSAFYHEVIKIVGVSTDYEAVARCEASLQWAFGARVTAARSQPYYLDVTHPEANKGAVVDRLARYLKVSPRGIATIGDQVNDVLMFKASGLSIAMGNASADVQRQATFVTTSFGEEGFANAVDRFVLPRTQLSKVI